MNKVAAASSEEEILDAIRGFVNGWTAIVEAELPEICEPREIGDRASLVKFAADVTGCYRSRRHRPGAAYVLKEMVEVLNFAVERVAQMTEKPAKAR